MPAARGPRSPTLAVLLAAALLTGAASGCTDDPEPRAEAAPTTTTAPEATTTEATEPPSLPTFATSIEGVTAEQLHASWRPGCPHPVEELRLVRAPHWGFDGEVHQGAIVVDVAVVEEIVRVLEALFEARYPIERMEPVDRYGGSDDASMAANNTSAFNCRPATGSTSWSEHAYGRAVDLNPLQNPYVRGDLVLPPQSAAYVDRSRTELGMIQDGDAAVIAFEREGWSWGGRWSTLRDYQHFQHPP